MGSPPPIEVATLSMWDTLLLMALALVVFGPRRLPMIGRQLGKLMYEFRKASNDFKFQMEEELRNAEEADRRKKAEEERQRALAAAPPKPQLEQTTPPAPESSAAAAETGPSAPATASDPYPSETTYPASAAQTTPSQPAIPPCEETASPAPTETAPRIQPPSIGETVASERSAMSPESMIREAESATPEAERSEPATHHG